MSVAESKTTDPITTVVDVLDGAADQLWTLRTPTVEPWEETTQQGRENRHDPAIYIWSPTDASTDAFSADHDHRLENHTVQCHIWTHYKDWTFQYARDVITILEMYSVDNKNLTNWTTIEPDTSGDLRAEKVVRRTDHYTFTVDVNLTGYNRTKFSNRTLVIADGEEYVIPEGVTQRWVDVEVEGTLTVNGELILTGEVNERLKTLAIEEGAQYVIPEGTTEHWHDTEVEGELIVEGRIILANE